MYPSKLIEKNLILKIEKCLPLILLTVEKARSFEKKIKKIKI